MSYKDTAYKIAHHIETLLDDDYLLVDLSYFEKVYLVRVVISRPTGNFAKMFNIANLTRQNFENEEAWYEVGSTAYVRMSDELRKMLYD